MCRNIMEGENILSRLNQKFRKMKTEPNDRINPIYEAHGGDLGTTSGGLTTREYFAAMAMQGICANPTTEIQPNGQAIAIVALECADALIAELNR